MKHFGLFEGIGGFSLAAEWMGWETVGWCEINSFCQQVLKYYWPDAERFGDITKSDFSMYANRVDILTGGFPCQPFSAAGRRKGSNDDRFLWPEMLRAIKEIQPTWVVAENVHGIINQSRGLVFEQVCTDLENKGYQVQPYLLPAAAVNGSHRRDRFWFCAYSQRYGLERKIQAHESDPKLYNRRTPNTLNGSVSWEGFDLQRTDEHLRRDNGVPNWVDRIKACGNAIVPQVAYQIFKAIEQYELTK